MLTAVSNTNGSNSITYLKEKEELLRQKQALMEQLNAKTDSPAESVQKEPEDKVSIFKRATDFAEEHPLLTQAAVFTGSAVAGYTVSKNGSNIAKGVKGFVGGTAGGIIGGTAGGTLAAGLLNNFAAPQIAAAAGGPAAIAVVLTGSIISSVVAGKVGQKIGSYIGRHI
ncbi:MAG: hypothetical protein AB2L14_06680 [Candidatus Xenobiia bacterium LiM19]